MLSEQSQAQELTCFMAPFILSIQNRHVRSEGKQGGAPGVECRWGAGLLSERGRFCARMEMFSN